MKIYEARHSRKIVRNTFYNFIGSAWNGLLVLLLTPYIVHRIGMERFGIWAIVGVLTGYFSLFDFGISASFVKYIAEFYARKEYDRINHLISTGFIFYVIFTTGIILLTYFFLNPLLSIIKIPSSLYAETVSVFWIGIITFCLYSILAVFGAMQTGLQRMDVLNKIRIATATFNAIGVIFLLERGYGLVGLMINSAVWLMIGGIVNIVIARKLFPKLQFKVFSFNIRMFKNLFNYGYKAQVANNADLILFQINIFLIAYFFNMSLVCIYQLGFLLLKQIGQVPLLLISALLPAASEIHVREEGKTKELYIRASKYLNFVSFPTFFFVAIAARPIMQIWMGSGYEGAVIITQILALGYLTSFTTGVGWTISLAHGTPEFGMRTAIIVVILNVFMAVVLIMTIGFIGTAIAVSVSWVFGALYFFVKLHKDISLGQRRFFKTVILPPLASSVVASALPCALNYLQIVHIHSVKYRACVLFAIEMVLFFTVYLIFIIKNKYIDSYDIYFVKKVLTPKIFRYLR